MLSKTVKRFVSLLLIVTAGQAFSENENYTYLEQGWTWDERVRFWGLGQGSEIMPFDWFLHLEQSNPDLQSILAKPSDADLPTGCSAIEKLENSASPAFIERNNIRRLGYVPWPAPKNDEPQPDERKVPIGFTRAANPHTGEVWLGLNCSACHTNLISYQEKTVLVEGAPTMGDYWKLNIEMAQALEQTYCNDQRFERFARNLSVPAKQFNQLRGKLRTVAEDRNSYNQRNEHEIEYGHGRLDAIGFIYNEVTGGRLSKKGEPTGSGVEENIRQPNAPVSYPFLWGTAQADYVQWNGVSYAQTPLGNLARDVVEVLGVYGKIDIDCKEDTFKSSMLFRNSKELGDMVATLKPPEWPSNVLPPIDFDTALKGRDIYNESCRGCHEVIPREDWDRHYKSSLWPMEIIGTDARYARNATEWVSSGCLAGRSIMHGPGPNLGEHATYYSIVTHVALGAMFEEFGEAVLPTLSMDGVWTNIEQNGLALREPDAVYKARPLNGIWATAPFLHNGSVATLKDLLSPPAERGKEVVTGCSDFDPVNVGYSCQKGPDTSVVEVNPESCVYDYENTDFNQKTWQPIEHLTTSHEGDRTSQGYYKKFPFRDARAPLQMEKIRDNGNCNFGHDIRKQGGLSFSEEEKMQLIEYLKTL